MFPNFGQVDSIEIINIGRCIGELTDKLSVKYKICLISGNTFIIITIIPIIITDFMDFKIELFLTYGWGKQEVGTFFKHFTIAFLGRLVFDCRSGQRRQHLSLEF